MTTKPKPYYDRDGITLYNGSAVQILPHLRGIHAVITDPPYSSGGQFAGDRTSRAPKEKYQQTATKAVYPHFTGDNRDQRSYRFWTALWMELAAEAAIDGGVLLSFSDWRQLPVTTDAIQAGGWTWRGIAAWDKKNARPMKGKLRQQTEFIAWGSKGPMPQDGPCLPGVYRHFMHQAERRHITPKPLALMEELCKVAWRPRAVILDPFAGSGTTLIAARNLGIKAVGIELSRDYCNVAIERLEQRAAA